MYVPLHEFLKQVGPNKQVGWRKKAVNLKRVGLNSGTFQKTHLENLANKSNINNSKN